MKLLTKRLLPGLLIVCMLVTLIPASAYAASETTVTNWTQLVDAVKNGQAGDVIRLGNDIDATSSASLKVTKNITVDGQGYTIDAQGKTGLFVTKGGSLTLENTRITNAIRSKEKQASVFYAYSGGGGTFENCIIDNCTDTYSSGSGVIYSSSYALKMTNCTVIDNSIGVTIGNTGGTVSNSIIAGNTKADIAFKSTSSLAKDGGYNLIGNCTNKPFGFTSDTTVIDSSLDSHSSWLTSEGELIAIAENPAIDKIPAGTTTLPVQDLYGTGRPSGQACDIGAIEYAPDTGNLTGIKITTPPYQTKYVEGNYFNKSGMVVTGYYENEDGTTSSKVLRSYTCQPTERLTLDDTKITVSYNGMTAEQEITVSEADKINNAYALKSAIATSPAGSVITLTGDITLDSTWGNVVVSKNLTIDGNGYTIDGNGTQAFLKMTTENKNGYTVNVQNLIIQNMYSSSGAAVIDATKKNPTINMTNCIVRDNTGYHGTIYTSTDGTVNINHCTIINNTALSSSKYAAVDVNKTLNISNSIVVNNISYNSEYQDIYKAASASYNVIGVVQSGTLSSTNTVNASYRNYFAWMSESGELYYPALTSKGNPAVDINPTETNPSGAASQDIMGNTRPSGKGSDAGAIETTAIDAAKPVITKNLSADITETLIGEEIAPLEITAQVSDTGTLNYEWYYIDYIDATTSATVEIKNHNEPSFTPSTTTVGNRGYFVVAYNSNTTDPWINGRNGVLDKTTSDTRRATGIYAISEVHQVNVNAGDFELTGIEVAKKPDKTEYVEGQKLNQTGLEVDAIYSNGAKYPLTGFRVEDHVLTCDSPSVVIDYKGFSTELTVSVVPKVMTKVEITKSPSKVNYEEGDSFDPSGMEVTASYNDETTAVLSSEAYTIESGDNLTREITRITVKPVGSDLTAVQKITVGINNSDQLIDAVQKAKSGDTIKLTNNISLSAPITINKNLTIDGQGVTVDGGGNTNFIVLTSGSLVLKNMLITGMISEENAAVVYCTDAADLTLNNCVITRNAGAMGAVYFAPKSVKTLTVDHCSIFNNLSGTWTLPIEQGGNASVNAVQTTLSGGINAGRYANASITCSVIVGNGLRAITSGFDLRLDKAAASGGNNIIGSSYGLTQAETDSVNIANSQYERWMNSKGAPVTTEDAPFRSLAEDQMTGTDMFGRDMNIQAGAVALVPAKEPVITTNLQDALEVTRNEPFELSVVAESPDQGTLSYQWYFNNEEIQNAEASDLKIDNAEDSHAGDYYVVVTNTTAGKSTSVQSAICKVSISEPASDGFEDVSADAYFAKAVAWAVKNGITNGVDATHFAPEKDCTRAQVITMIWRAMGCPEVEGVTNPFVDVKESDYFYKAVLWAVKEGVTQGVDPTHFGPNKTVTRGQTVTFLWRAAGQETVSGENIFSDVNPGDYYYKAVLWAVKNGITNGMTATTFSPNSGCTRGQIVTFLYRHIEK